MRDPRHVAKLARSVEELDRTPRRRVEKIDHGRLALVTGGADIGSILQAASPLVGMIPTIGPIAQQMLPMIGQLASQGQGQAQAQGDPSAAAGAGAVDAGSLAGAPQSFGGGGGGHHHSRVSVYISTGGTQSS